MQTQPSSQSSPIDSMRVLQSRRAFFSRTLKAAAGAALLAPSFARAQSAKPGMTVCLTPGSIGVSADQQTTIALAEQFGFEAVEPFGGYLASLSEQQVNDLAASLSAKGLVWGAAGLTVEYRRDEERFKDGMRELPKIAAALARAGANRVGTWLSPGHASSTYLENFKQHARRLREVAQVLKDHGHRFGLEYVGTLTSRSRLKFPFARTMAETRELIAEIGTGNVGFVLDSWHWWQAGDSVEDILTLKNEDVVSVDLNDAPVGVEKDQQRDNQRELPCATGVIDLESFMKALQKIGYTGPARPEPFNRTLNQLDNEAACAATIQAMRKALAFIR